MRYERILSKNFLLPPYHKHYFRGFLPACRASKQKSRFRAAHQPIKHTGRSPPFKFLIYYSYHVNLIICMRLTLSSIYPQPPNIPPRRNLASKVPPFTITLFVLKSTPQNHPPPYSNPICKSYKRRYAPSSIFINSSCLPCSTIFPSLKTKILSAFLTVLKRWATIKVVLPFISLPKDS